LSSAPSTDSAAVVAVTVDGDAAAAVATVGAALLTVIEADVATDPQVAVTVAAPATDGAVYKPEASTDPAPATTAHASAGWTAIGSPNWSSPVATSCCVWFSCTVVVAGATVMPVSAWSTLTLTADVAVPPWPSSIVTVNV
jgi:hypothetical protein